MYEKDKCKICVYFCKLAIKDMLKKLVYIYNSVDNVLPYDKTDIEIMINNLQEIDWSRLTPDMVYAFNILMSKYNIIKSNVVISKEQLDDLIFDLFVCNEAIDVQYEIEKNKYIVDAEYRDFVADDSLLGKVKKSLEQKGLKKVFLGVLCVCLVLIMVCCTSSKIMHSRKDKNTNTEVYNEQEYEDVKQAEVEEVDEVDEIENSYVKLSEEEKRVIGNYRGYYCTGEYKRGLELEIWEEDGLKASFEFYPLGNNDDFQAGKYLMDVEYEAGEYCFYSTEWIDYPDGYSTIDLYGCLKDGILSGVTDDDLPFYVIKDGGDYVQDVWLTSLEPIYEDENVYVENVKIGVANTGEKYCNYMYSQQPYSEIIYQLNGEYDTLTGLWSICFSDRDDEGINSFEIYADNQLVYTSQEIKSGSLPEEVCVDLHNCNILRIRFKEGDGTGEFGNILLSNSQKKNIPTSVQEIGVLPCWLTDLDYLTCNDVKIQSDEIGESSTGEHYTHYLSGGANDFVEYYLDGQYNLFSAKWGVCACHDHQEDACLNSFEMYADGELIYSSPSVANGEAPVEINVDIKKCKVLKIVFKEGNHAADLYNIYLTSEE